MHALDELRNEAYENARIFKEKVKRWHDKRIEHRVFKTRDKVLLYNSRLRLFPGKLKSRWEGPYEIAEAYPSGAVRLKGTSATPWIFSGQRLKHYRSGEVNETLVIHFIDEEEFFQKRYGDLIS
jgi:hypothetical protein